MIRPLVWAAAILLLVYLTGALIFAAQGGRVSDFFAGKSGETEGSDSE